MKKPKGIRIKCSHCGNCAFLWYILEPGKMELQCTNCHEVVHLVSSTNNRNELTIAIEHPE